MELDSIDETARLMQEHAQSVLNEYIQEQDGGPTETDSEAPGAYGSCSGHIL